MESAFAVWTGGGGCRSDIGAEGLGAVALEVDGVGAVETIGGLRGRGITGRQRAGVRERGCRSSAFGENCRVDWATCSDA